MIWIEGNRGFHRRKNFGEKNDFGEKLVNQKPTKTEIKRGVLKMKTPQTQLFAGFRCKTR
jgi:hypothetical protein